MKLVVTDCTDKRFVELCALLDDEYYRLFGQLALQYKEKNRIEESIAAILLVDETEIMGGGCVRNFDGESAEIKRLIVKEKHRRKGFAQQLMSALEQTAAESGYVSVVLQTSHLMPWATAL